MCAPEGPRAGHLQAGGGCRRGWIEVPAELLDEASDLLDVELVRAPERVEDARLNAAPCVPLALDELEVASVRAALTGRDDFSKVHVQQDRKKPAAESRGM